MKKIFIAILMFFMGICIAAENEISQTSNESSSDKIISKENQNSANEILQDENSAEENSLSNEKSAPSEIVKKENPQKTQGWNFAIEPIFGMRFGKEGEIVWAKNSRNGKRYKLSELEWEYTPAWYLGGKVFANYKRFEITSTSKFFMPTHCGTIKDSDWLQDYGYAKMIQEGFPYTADTSVKTNYSESENHITTAIDFELSFSYKFYPTYFLTLRPKISASYQRMKFKAIGGQYWYGKILVSEKFGRPYNDSSYFPYNDIENSVSDKLPDETVLKYDTRSIYIWTGIQADFIPTKKIVLSLAIEFAPFVYMLSYDNHVMKGYDYKQYSTSAFFMTGFGKESSISPFFAVRPSFTAIFNFTDFISIALNFNGVFTSATEGPNYGKSQSTPYQTGCDNFGNIINAGGYSMYFDAGISIKFSL